MARTGAGVARFERPAGAAWIPALGAGEHGMLPESIPRFDVRLLAGVMAGPGRRSFQAFPVRLGAAPLRRCGMQDARMEELPAGAPPRRCTARKCRWPASHLLSFRCGGRRAHVTCKRPLCRKHAEQVRGRIEDKETRA